MRCPQCKRNVKTHLNRFGDECYNHHMMATIQDWKPVEDQENMSEAHRDFLPGYNPIAYSLYQIDCPMSGQPIGSF